MLQAAKEGNLKSLKAFLDSGVRPDIIDNNKMSALHLATLYGNLECVQLLLTYNSEYQLTKLKDFHGCIALQNACRAAKYPEIVKVLLQADSSCVNIPARDEVYGGFTLLQIACWWNHFSILQLLIEAGAELNCKNSVLHRSIILASKRGSIECLLLLLNGGADVSYINGPGSAIYFTFSKTIPFNKKMMRNIDDFSDIINVLLTYVQDVKVCLREHVMSHSNSYVSLCPIQMNDLNIDSLRILAYMNPRYSPKIVITKYLDKENRQSINNVPRSWGMKINHDGTFLENVESLQNLSRLRIRQILYEAGFESYTNFKVGLEKLGIPKCLQLYIRYLSD